MDDRARRIVESAMELAVEDGFEAVRLRDVAAQANVALGTVYKRFRSKEEILVAALAVEADRLREQMGDAPPSGQTPRERVSAFFATATRFLLEQPNLARALVRSMATGGPTVHDKVASYHGLVTLLLVAALRGDSAQARTQLGGESDQHRGIAEVLQHVWFSALVGWATGIHDDAHVLSTMDRAVALVVPDGSLGQRTRRA